MPGGRRVRLDRLHAGTAVAVAPVENAASPSVLIVETPAFLVLAVPDAADGRLSPHDRQVLGAARLLADAGGGAVILLAPPLEDAPGPAGADRLASLPRSDRDYDPESRAAAVAAAVAALKPRHVVFPESADGGDLARRVAAALDEALFANAEAVSPRSVARPARGRRVEQRAAPERLLSLAPDRVPAYAGPPREARPVPLAVEASAPRGITSVETLAVRSAEMPLADADFVAAAGNGVTDLALFARTAQALGAAPGASRVLCDAGLMPRDRQVGASGTVLEATCYLALGIAGAPQHLQGVARVQHIVAVNTDLHAAMVARADLAVIADAQAVMPALIALLNAERR